jgi:hypothetical protein
LPAAARDDAARHGALSSIRQTRIPCIPVFGTVNAATSVVGAGAAILAGLSYDWLGTYTPAFIGCAALSGTSAVAIILVRPPKKADIGA